MRVTVTERMALPTYVGMEIHIWGVRSGIKRVLHSAAEARKIKHPQTDAVGSAGRMWPQRGWAGAGTGLPGRHQVPQLLPRVVLALPGHVCTWDTSTATPHPVSLAATANSVNALF